MLKPLTAANARIRLDDCGVVRVQGPDAVKFLQGQVSNDVTKLSATRSLFAGLHNAQGRVIALLRLVLVGADEVLAIVPRELAGPVAQRLSKFVLRAKAKVTDASGEWAVEGATGDDGTVAPAEVQTGSVRADDLVPGKVWVCIDVSPPRWFVLTPASAAPDNANRDSRETWRALDIAAGLPQVYAATSEAFVAQMLNLDVLDGIAFDKGCYTGQEVIARAHYRGRVKRRMQRFRTTVAARLNPGDAGHFTDGRSYRVVDAVTLADGSAEFLAVTTLGSGDEAPESAAPSEGTATAPALAVEHLPLPYPLPA